MSNCPMSNCPILTFLSLLILTTQKPCEPLPDDFLPQKFVLLKIYQYLCRKIEMSDDIFESVSQRGYGAYDEENRRIQEVSDELQRLCRLYEEEPRDGKSYGGRFEIEQRNPASEDDMDDNGMSRYMENNDEEGWD